MLSKQFIIIILFTTIFGETTKNIEIYHIPPPTPEIGGSVSFETIISTDIDVIEAIFLYRIYGQHAYKEIEMEESLGGTWITSISKIPECSSIEYFFLFKQQDGLNIFLPQGEPSQNPFILSVTPLPIFERNAQDSTAISIDQEDPKFLIISPNENDIIYSDALLYMISLYNIPDIDTSSIHIYLDNQDVTSDAFVTQDIITYAPNQVEPGIKTIRITASTINEDTIPPFNHIISVIRSKKSTPKFSYSIKGKSDVSMDQVAIDQGDDEKLNIYQTNLYIKGGWPRLQFKSRFKITSEESPYKQPKNRYSATINSGKFLKISLGDFNPSLSPYTINGKRIRGVGTEWRLGWLQFQSAHGELNRAIQGINNADYSYKLSNISLDTTKVIYELDRLGYTFKQDMSSYRFALNIRDKIIFGSTFMKSKNNIQSVKKELPDAIFTISPVDIATNQTQLDSGTYSFSEFQESIAGNNNFSYLLADSSWGGNKPKQNLVVGTDFRFSLDENKFLLEGYWGISLLNKDIWEGTMTLAQMDTLMGDPEDGLIMGSMDTLSMPDPTKVEEYMTINMNLVPIVPIDITLLQSDPIKAVMNMPSTAYNLKFRSLYFNNIFEVQYSQVGPEFTSLANPYFPKNIREYAISDKMMFFDRRLQTSLHYKEKTNDILETNTNPYNENTYGINLNYIPGIEMPSAMYGHHSIIRKNQTSKIDTLTNTTFSYVLQDLRVDFTTKNNLLTLNVPIKREDASYTVGGTYNSIVGTDRIEKDRLDILSSLIDTSEAAWDTTYSLSNSIISIDSSPTSWDTTYTRFISQNSNMQLISLFFAARYKNGLKLSLNISNFTYNHTNLGNTKLNGLAITGGYPILPDKLNLSGTLSFLSSTGLSEFNKYGLSLGGKIKISKTIRINLATYTKVRSTSSGTEVSNLSMKLSTNYIF